MEVFACLAESNLRVAVEADPDETVASLQAKAVSCLRAEGQLLGAVQLCMSGSAEPLSGDMRLEHTPLQQGDTFEVVRIRCLPGETLQTEVYGDDKGVPFNDYGRTAHWGRVRNIGLASVPSSGITLRYSNGSAACHGVMDPCHWVNLSSDEYVTGIEGWAGDVVYQMTIFTNKRQCGPYGTKDIQRLRDHSSGEDIRRFSTHFNGYQLLFVHGRVSPDGATLIGFGYGQQPGS